MNLLFKPNHSAVRLNKLIHPITVTAASNNRSILQLHLKKSASFSALYYSSQTSSNSENAQEVQGLISMLRSDLKHSMKVKDFTQRDVIKSLLGDLQNSEHTKSPKSHEKVIDSAIKKRVEAAKISMESNPPRVEINQQNLNEVEILKKYASFLSSTRPTQASNHSDLIKIVDESMEKFNLSADTSLQERHNSLGKLIKSVKEKVGSDFDGKQIADAVRKALQLP